MSHTAIGASNAKPKEKVFKLFDGGGLYLLLKPAGYKARKYDYRIDKSRGKYTIGSYAASYGERTRGLVVPRRRRGVVLSELER